MNTTLKTFGRNIEKIGMLSSPSTEESLQQKTDRSRRIEHIWNMWESLNSNLPVFCRFVRVTIFNLSEREFASLTGLKPIMVKKVEDGETDGGISAQMEIALIGLLHLYRVDDDVKKMEEGITILKKRKEEASLQQQFVSELLELIDISNRDVSRFVKSLSSKYHINTEELAFVMDTTPQGVEELEAGMCADSRRLFCAIEFNIEEHAKRLAMAIFEPMDEGDREPERAAASPTAEAGIPVDVDARGVNGEATSPKA